MDQVEVANDVLEGVSRKRADILAQIAILGQQLDPDRYVDDFSFSGSAGYGNIKHQAIIRERELEASGDKVRLLYNQYLVVSLLEDFDPAAGHCLLPDSVAALYPRELKRIMSQLDTCESRFFRFECDAFVKDLSILKHRLIPVGAEYADPYSGVPRSLLFKGGARQLYKGIRACLVQAGGFWPFLELHAHILALEDFNPAGWRKTYVRLAELLELNPRFRGVTSSSWFLDPALEGISPHLSYLRREPEAQGATILFSSIDREGKSGALAKSSSRRRLFNEGRYIPTVYTRVWPRSELIAWKSQNAVGVAQ